MQFPKSYRKDFQIEDLQDFQFKLATPLRLREYLVGFSHSYQEHFCTPRNYMLEDENQRISIVLNEIFESFESWLS
jgi:hypothetical protein